MKVNLEAELKTNYPDEVKNIIADSPSTGKRICLADRGYIYNGKHYIALIIEKKLTSDGDDYIEEARFPLTKERAVLLANSLIKSFETN